MKSIDAPGAMGGPDLASIVRGAFSDYSSSPHQERGTLFQNGKATRLNPEECDNIMSAIADIATGGSGTATAGTQMPATVAPNFPAISLATTPSPADASKTTYSRPQGLLPVADSYRFARGMQVDEAGNIWDCPSLRNIQYHQKMLGPLNLDRVYAVINRTMGAIINTEMIEDFTRVVLNGPGSELPMNVRREVTNDSTVSAIWGLGQERLSIPKYKIGDFRLIDTWNGIDLKASLKEFQKSIGKTISAPNFKGL